MNPKNSPPAEQELLVLAETPRRAFSPALGSLCPPAGGWTLRGHQAPFAPGAPAGPPAGGYIGGLCSDEDSRTRFLVVDADDDPDWRRLNGLARVLGEMECASYLEHSRRGGHLWLFFAEPVAGKEVRRFGRGLLAHFGIEDIELFPKQDKLSTGPGSLIRLPFGVHQKSGRRYGFYHADGRPLAPTLREQIMALRAPETVPAPVFEQFRQTATTKPARPL